MGCRRRRPSPDLVRVVVDASGEIVIGRTLPGRGAWLCPDNPACLAAASKRDALGRALRRPLRPDAYARLHTLLTRPVEIPLDVRE